MMLWAAWAGVTALGWAAAGLAYALLAPGTDLLQYLFLPLSAVGQWLLLRRHFARASMWLLATAAGCAAAAGALAILQALPESLAGPPDSGVRSGLSLVADGLSLGVAQWLVLRGSVRGVERWIAAVGLPLWLYGLPLLQRGFESLGAADLGDPSDFVEMVATTFGTFGLLIGALTGAVMAWLVDQPRADEEDVM
jgi:hypothetical protein